MTHLRKMMLEELERRNYARTTIDCYIQTIYGELIVAQKQALGPDNPATLLSTSHAAESLEEEGRFPDAEKLYSEVIAAQRRVLGPEHPQTLRAMTMLALTMALVSLPGMPRGASRSYQ